MKGNFPVPFLGEGAAVTPLSYPTRRGKVTMKEILVGSVHPYNVTELHEVEQRAKVLRQLLAGAGIAAEVRITSEESCLGGFPNAYYLCVADPDAERAEHMMTSLAR